MTALSTLSCQSWRDAWERRGVKASYEDAVQRGRVDQAEAPAEELLNLARRSGVRALIAEAAIDLGKVERQLSRSELARQLYDEALREAEAAGSSRPVLRARALHGIASIQAQAGQFEPAERLLREGMSLVSGREAVRYGLTETLAVIYAGGLHRDTEAEAILRAALPDLEQEFGPQSARVGEALANLAEAVFFGREDRITAEQTFDRALAILDRALPAGHPDAASARGAFCNVEHWLGEYERASVLCGEAMRALESNPAMRNSVDLAALLDSMGTLYFVLGREVEAERYLLRSRQIWEQRTGSESIEVGRVLRVLGSLYSAHGYYDQAKALLEKSLQIRTKILGEADPEIVDSLLAVATAASRSGDRKEAAALLLRARQILTQPPAGSGPSLDPGLLAAVLGDLSRDCDEPCSAGDRLKLAEESRDLLRKTFGSNHDQGAGAQIAVASVLAERRDYKGAVAALQQAYAVLRGSRGELSIHTKWALGSLAWYQSRQGDRSHALQNFSAMEEMEEQQLRTVLGAVSEDRQWAYLQDARRSLDYLVTFQQRAASRSEAAQRLVLRALLRRKARALDATGAQLAAARGQPSSGGNPGLAELRKARGELASLALGERGRLSVEEYGQRIAALEARQRELEAALVELGQLAPSPEVTVESVGAALPRRAALLEVVRYTPIAEKRARYALYALKDQGQSVAVRDLGDAPALDAKIEVMRQSLQHPGGEASRHGRILDRVLLQPLEGFLAGVDQVFVAPDGALHLLPFAALVDARGHYRLERWEFTALGSGRDLLERPRNGSGSSQPALVLGAPDFDAAGEAEPAIAVPAAGGRTAAQDSDGVDDSNGTPLLRGEDQTVTNARSGDLGERRFGALPATRSEVEAVARLLDVKPLLGVSASEEQLKQARSPRILHVASHGFFLKDLTSSARSSTAPIDSSGLGLPFITPHENPMLRSGLALSGANVHRSEGGEDGILTALEAATLQLSGTDLVTLSACDTGVGEIDRGEGVLGLRRGFALAGARSILMSLWSVNDVATGRLMERYYARLRRGEGRSAALRAVQREFLANPVLADPYYWAAFILAGEPGPLSLN